MHYVLLPHQLVILVCGFNTLLVFVITFKKFNSPIVQ